MTSQKRWHTQEEIAFHTSGLDPMELTDELDRILGKGYYKLVVREDSTPREFSCHCLLTWNRRMPTGWVSKYQKGSKE